MNNGLERVKNQFAIPFESFRQPTHRLNCVPVLIQWSSNSFFFIAGWCWIFTQNPLNLNLRMYHWPVIKVFIKFSCVWVVWLWCIMSYKNLTACTTVFVTHLNVLLIKMAFITATCESVIFLLPDSLKELAQRVVCKWIGLHWSCRMFVFARSQLTHFKRARKSCFAYALF